MQSTSKSDTYCYRDSDSHGYRNIYPDTNTHRDCHGYGYLHAYAYSNGHVYPNPYSYCYCYCYSYTHTNTDAHTHIYGYRPGDCPNKSRRSDLQR